MATCSEAPPRPPRSSSEPPTRKRHCRKCSSVENWKLISPTHNPERKLLFQNEMTQSTKQTNWVQISSTHSSGSESIATPGTPCTPHSQWNTSLDSCDDNVFHETEEYGASLSMCNRCCDDNSICSESCQNKCNESCQANCTHVTSCCPECQCMERYGKTDHNGMESNKSQCICMECDKEGTCLEPCGSSLYIGLENKEVCDVDMYQDLSFHNEQVPHDCKISPSTRRYTETCKEYWNPKHAQQTLNNHKSKSLPIRTNDMTPGLCSISGENGHCTSDLRAETCCKLKNTPMTLRHTESCKEYWNPTHARQNLNNHKAKSLPMRTKDLTPGLCSISGENEPCTFKLRADTSCKPMPAPRRTKQQGGSNHNHGSVDKTYENSFVCVSTDINCNSSVNDTTIIETPTSKTEQTSVLNQIADEESYFSDTCKLDSGQLDACSTNTLPTCKQFKPVPKPRIGSKKGSRVTP